MSCAENSLHRKALLTVVLGGIGLGLAGCASDGGSPFGLFATEQWVRGYVREQNAPIEAKQAELDARLSKVDSRVSQVAAQTSEARKVADEGVRKADAANARLTRALAERNNRTLVESKSLQFTSGRFALQPEHMKLLDGVHEALRNNPTYTADIVGQADAPGGKADNSLLSWRRTEHVRRYLAEKGDVLHRIAFIGLGEDLALTTKPQADRRQVLVVVYRPATD